MNRRATSGSWTTSAALFSVLHDVQGSHTRAVPSVSYLFYSTNVWTWRVAHLLKCIRCCISIDWYRFTIGCFPNLCVIMTNKPQRSTYSAWSWRMFVNHLTIYPRVCFCSSGSVSRRLSRRFWKTKKEKSTKQMVCVTWPRYAFTVQRLIDWPKNRLLCWNGLYIEGWIGFWTLPDLYFENHRQKTLLLDLIMPPLFLYKLW